MVQRNRRRYPGFISLFVGLASCGGDGNDQSAASATSNLCPNVTGTEAILWDLYNSVIRTDVSVLPPPIPTGGASYTHPGFPLLGFIYPGGWAPETIRFGNHTAVIDASVTALPGFSNSKVRSKVVASPTAEFPTRAVDTFLAIDWQMLIGDSSNLFDRDGDGWLDGVDEFPDDPTRH